MTTDLLVTRLVTLDTLKTWSLIVTLFGDLDGKDLSGTEIRTLLGQIGIKPEAIRVALHRLKSDQWITSSKQGREAIYRLSDNAMAETEAVAEDVYRIEPSRQADWSFQFTQEALPHQSAIELSKNLTLVRTGSVRPDPAALMLVPKTPEMPDWIGESLVSEQSLELANELGDVIAQYGDVSDTRDRVLFRVLVVHHWRRIVLRKGSLAHAAFFPDGAIARCQALVARFLEMSERPKSTV